MSKEELLMKRGLKLLISMIAALLLLFSATALADTLRFGTVSNSNSVNLRESTSTKSERLGSYKRNTWVRVTGQAGDWYKVIGPDGKSGYMMKQYIYISAGAKGIIGITDVKDSVNMRAKPSASAKIVGTYRDGVPCILLSESGGWYHVTVDNKAGYIDADYIEKKYMTYSTDVATVISSNGGSVNIRKGPGKNYSVIKSVKHGTYVMILQTGTDWWKISVNGTVGYMDSDFLKDGIVNNPKPSGSTGSSSGSSAGSTGSSSGSGYAVVNNPGANQKLFLRQSASRSSKALGAFGNGTQVTVLSQGTTWCKVKVNGVTGYMMTEYLKFHGLQGTKTAYVDHPNETFVNMRNAPSQSTGKILYKVPHGAKVTILTPGNTWCEIMYKGKTGYMMTRFLD